MELSKDFFNLLLDFGEDWQVTKVDSDHRLCVVTIHIEYCSDTYYDPRTYEVVSLYDHAPERKFRHLDILQYKCYISTRIPRVKCGDGSVLTILTDWCDSYSRHTYRFEEKVILTLQATKNQSKAAALIGTTPKVVNHIMHSSVERGLARRDLTNYSPGNVGIDEKLFKNGDEYITVLTHTYTGTVIDVCYGRSGDATKELLTNTLSPKALSEISTVTMDMWKPYINSIRELCPNSEIIHDRYHLVAHLNKSIDDVRRKEVGENPILRNSRYALLKNAENRTDNQSELFEEIMKTTLSVTEVYNAKENFRGMFDATHNEKDGLLLLVEWAKNAFMKNITQLSKVVLMMLEHHKGVVNALISNLTNATAERINGKIQEVKSIARGYNTFKQFRSAILFFEGGLSLFPLKRS